MKEYNTCNEMFLDTLNNVLVNGKYQSDSTFHGKQVSGQDYEKLELVFYGFTVKDTSDLETMLKTAKKETKKDYITMHGAKTWFYDMIENTSLRENFWQQHPYTKTFFENVCADERGNASYSYGQRVVPQLPGLFKRLSKNLNSGAAVINVYNETDINNIGKRSPCTVNYHFMFRDNKMNNIINMRACDVMTFFALDFAKGVLFKDYVAHKLNVEGGNVSMVIDSLHAYKKDLVMENNK